jgi:hypothetical protein
MLRETQEGIDNSSATSQPTLVVQEAMTVQELLAHLSALALGFDAAFLQCFVENGYQYGLVSGG